VCEAQNKLLKFNNFFAPPILEKKVGANLLFQEILAIFVG
jgi:hypothetical protein